jgi:hypothetical protein
MTGVRHFQFVEAVNLKVTTFPVVTARCSCRKTPSLRRNKLSAIATKLFYPQSNLAQAITFAIYFKDTKF